MSIILVDQYGKPLEGVAEIEIKSSGIQKKVTLETRGTVTLPYGDYMVGGWSGTRVDPYRLVVIREPRTQLVLTFTPREPGDGRPAPWIISGRITPAPAKNKTVVVRLIGLYSSASEETVVGDDGHFTLHAWQISPYKLWVLTDGKRVAERDIEVEFYPKTLPPIEIHLSEPK